MGEVTTLPTQDIFEPKLKPLGQTVDPIDRTTYKEHHASRVSPENPFVPPPRISIGALSSSITMTSHDEGTIKPDPSPVAEPPKKLLWCHRGQRNPCAPTILARTTPLGFCLRIRPRRRLNPMIHQCPLLIRRHGLSRRRSHCTALVTAVMIR
jgi:hypothetical protein